MAFVGKSCHFSRTMKYLCVFLSSFLLASCSHSRWKPSDVPLGKSKSIIVESLGSPQRTWRKDGKDYWYYNPSTDDKSQRVIFVFESGRLVEKVRAGAVGIPSAEAADFEELEAELKKLKPQSSENFETLSD